MCSLSLPLQVLRESVDTMVQQTKSLMMNSDIDHHSTLHNHNQLLLRQQLGELDRAVSELQVKCLIDSSTLENYLNISDWVDQKTRKEISCVYIQLIRGRDDGSLWWWTTPKLIDKKGILRSSGQEWTFTLCSRGMDWSHMTLSRVIVLMTLDLTKSLKTCKSTWTLTPMTCDFSWTWSYLILSLCSKIRMYVVKRCAAKQPLTINITNQCDSSQLHCTSRRERCIWMHNRNILWWQIISVNSTITSYSQWASPFLPALTVSLNNFFFLGTSTGWGPISVCNKSWNLKWNDNKGFKTRFKFRQTPALHPIYTWRLLSG